MHLRLKQRGILDADLEDESQEIFEDLLRSARIVGVSNVRPYLAQICANRGADHARRRVANLPEITCHLFRGPEHAPSPEDFYLSAEAKAFVWDIMRRLPEPHGHVLALSLSDHTPRDIARILRVPAGTARSRLSRAIKAFKAELSRHGFWSHSLVAPQMRK